MNRSQLDLMLENIDFGNKNCIPLCQDTGLVNFFIQIGTKSPFLIDFKKLFLDVLEKLTLDAILRPNTVDPFLKSNQGKNGGHHQPPIYLDLIPDRDDLIISVLNKGGGAENISRLFMLSPSNGLNEFIPLILKTMEEAGGKPCPPVILGIGIGGDASKVMYLAKKALLRPLGSKNAREDVAKLEEKILTELNKMNIGIMGLGGHSNCLDVRIEWAMRHPASYPVGLIVQCYSHRVQTCRITADSRIEFGRLNQNYQFEKGDF